MTLKTLIRDRLNSNRVRVKKLVTANRLELLRDGPFPMERFETADIETRLVTIAQACKLLKAERELLRRLKQSVFEAN